MAKERGSDSGSAGASPSAARSVLRVLVLILLSSILLPAAPWIVGLYFLLRRTRYSLFDFCLLVWTAGLAIGLTMKLLPGDMPLALEAILSGLVGGLVFCGGTVGIYMANWLGLAHYAQRALMQLRGMLFLPAVPCAIALPFLIVAVASHNKDPDTLVLIFASLLIAVHGWSFLKLVWRVRKLERAAIERTGAAGAAPVAPVPLPAPPSSDPPDPPDSPDSPDSPDPPAPGAPPHPGAAPAAPGAAGRAAPRKPGSSPPPRVLE